jgi:cytochrome c oxidase cbb3-type subunit 3
MCSPSRSDLVRGALACLCACLLVAGCEREERRFDDAPPVTGEVESGLKPGGDAPTATAPSPYLGNAQAISAGKRLFEWYNCAGCHGHGGGGIGPALMDDEWIYGAAPENIFSAIIEGRPNGMPSFRGKVNAQETWQLVAFVQSLSGAAPFDVTSSRDDHLYTPWSPTAR